MFKINAGLRSLRMSFKPLYSIDFKGIRTFTKPPRGILNHKSEPQETYLSPIEGEEGVKRSPKIQTKFSNKKTGIFQSAEENKKPKTLGNKEVVIKMKQNREKEEKIVDRTIKEERVRTKIVENFVLEEDDREKIFKEVTEKIKIEDFYTSIQKLEYPDPIVSIFDRIKTHKVEKDGTIVTPHIFNKEGKSRKFASMEKYEKWRDEKIESLVKQIKLKLNPQEFWQTQAYGIERPFTGKYWDNEKVGIYSCKVCTQRLFSSTHKYKSDCGHASFWNFFPYSVKYSTDHVHYPEPTQAILKPEFENKPVKRASCSHCDSNIGLIFDDGPAPFFKRLIANSGSIQFLELDFIQSPIEKRELKRLRYEKKQEMLHMEIANLYYEKKRNNSGVIKYLAENIVENEKKITNRSLNEATEKK